MIVTRFAPSPTGNLHIGGLRTALYNYLYAKKHNGKFLLRIEDTDTARNKPEALDSIFKALKWCGLEHDGEILMQSKREDIYKSYIQKLLDEKKAYYCYLSKEELESYREGLKQGSLTHSFTRKYRDFEGKIDSLVKPVVRIKAPLEGSICFKDGIKGDVEIKAKELDDFIIARSDLSPTYNFVVAIDDALSGVSDVIRGDDHLSNTPKQVIIYNALGFKMPNFFHVPMICNAFGKKLSKRDGALSVLEYKNEGYLKQALLNFLFRLGFSDGDKEIFSQEEMIDIFNPYEIHSKPSSCNFSKLTWLNEHYIKQMSKDELAKELDCIFLSDLEDEKIEVLFSQLKTRCSNLLSFKKAIEDILTQPAFLREKAGKLQVCLLASSYDEKLFKNITKSSILALKQFCDKLDSKSFASLELITSYLHDFIDNLPNLVDENGTPLALKTKSFMQALRVGLLGKSGGIELPSCLFILGIDEVSSRLQVLLTHFKNTL